MKKKKTKLKDPIKIVKEPPVTDGMKKIKLGAQVMYRTPYLFDKCEVVELDKKNSIAILSNQVKVSRGISRDGHLTKLGVSTERTEIKVWDDECQTQYDIFVSVRGIKNITAALIKYLDKVDERVIDINNSLSELASKFKIRY